MPKDTCTFLVLSIELKLSLETWSLVILWMNFLNQVICLYQSACKNWLCPYFQAKSLIGISTSIIYPKKPYSFITFVLIYSLTYSLKGLKTYYKINAKPWAPSTPNLKFISEQNDTPNSIFLWFMHDDTRK